MSSCPHTIDSSSGRRGHDAEHPAAQAFTSSTNPFASHANPPSPPQTTSTPSANTHSSQNTASSPPSSTSGSSPPQSLTSSVPPSRSPPTYQRATHSADNKPRLKITAQRADPSSSSSPSDTPSTTFTAATPTNYRPQQFLPSQRGKPPHQVPSSGAQPRQQEATESRPSAHSDPLPNAAISSTATSTSGAGGPVTRKGFARPPPPSSAPHSGSGSRREESIISQEMANGRKRGSSHSAVDKARKRNHSSAGQTSSGVVDSNRGSRADSAKASSRAHLSPSSAAVSVNNGNSQFRGPLQLGKRSSTTGADPTLGRKRKQSGE